MSANLLIERRGRVAHLILNRPEKRNALNLAMSREIVHAVEDAWQDREIGAILISGSGPTFCAGMDLSEMLTPGADELSHVHENLFTLGARSTKPLVAAVEGAALAGGAGLVANAHVVFAAETATFGLTEIRIALWPFLVFRAVQLAIGERRAVELALTGRVVTAREAEHYGLVHQVTLEGQAFDRALAASHALASSSPEATRAGLQFVNEVRGRGWDEQGKAAWEYRDELFRSADFAEGVKAFREKREPRWPSLDE